MNDPHCKVLNWNIRGLNNLARRQVLRDLIADNACNIACIQETKLRSSTTYLGLMYISFQ
jgi:exonuclease III